MTRYAVTPQGEGKPNGLRPVEIQDGAVREATERCALCGKIWGDHFDGDFCDRDHGPEEEEMRLFTAAPPAADPAPVDDPALPEPIMVAIAEFEDAAFNCGEWTKDDDEPYEAVYAACRAAERALVAAIADALAAAEREREEWKGAGARIAAAVDRLSRQGDCVPADLAATVEAMRREYTEMCERLHGAVQRHNLGLGGERVDALVVEALDKAERALADKRFVLDGVKRALASAGELAALRWQITLACSALENWGRHHEWCARDTDVPCNCGLADAIDAARRAVGADQEG